MWMGDAAQGTPPGTSPTGFDFTGLVTALAPLATTVMSAIDQQKLLDYNMQLLAQGKPPLTPDQLVALQSGFAPQVQVGLSTGTTNVVKDIAIGGGLLVGALVIINMLGGGSAGRSQRMARAYNR